MLLKCGEWHLPPRCDEFYILWLEQGFEISDQVGLMTGECQVGAATMGSKLLAPMQPAGIVALAQKKQLQPDESFRTISSSGFVRRTFDSSLANQGYLVPTGQIVSVVHHSDPDGGKYVEATRPFSLEEGETITVLPVAPPENSGHLILKLRGDPRLVPEASADLVDFSGERHRPGFSAPVRGSKVLIFYDLPVGKASVGMQGKAWAPPYSLTIKGGEIVEETLQFLRLPNLEVTYSVPEGVCREITLNLLNAVSGENIQTKNLDSIVGSVQFEAVPATLLTADLRCGRRRVTGSIDLSDGRDAVIHLEPTAFKVEGTLFIDDEPGPGTIEFAGNGDWIRTSADESGRYSCVLFHPLEMVRARAEEAFDWRLFGISPPITEDEEKDLYLPAGSVSVEVLNSSTSEPIPNATVSYLMEEPKRGGDDPGGRQGSRGLTTNADGIVFLPGMFEGELELSVKASGFRDDDFSFQTPWGRQGLVSGSPRSRGGRDDDQVGVIKWHACLRRQSAPHESGV